MTRYHINEASFEVPKEFGDKTLNIFSIPDKAGGQVSLVITRDQPKQPLTLLRYSERIVMEMEERLPKFELGSRSDALLNGIPAVRLDYTWDSDGTRMVQRQLLTILPETPERGLLALSITFTGTKWTDLCESLFVGFLRTFTVRPSA